MAELAKKSDAHPDKSACQARRCHQALQSHSFYNSARFPRFYRIYRKFIEIIVLTETGPFGYTCFRDRSVWAILLQ
jgi:hypothetical protein